MSPTKTDGEISERKMRVKIHKPLDFTILQNEFFPCFRHKQVRFCGFIKQKCSKHVILVLHE
jgi:hypothetical protein